MLSGLPSYFSAFIMSCLTYIFFSLFLFVFVKNYISSYAALISVILISFVAVKPQLYIGWGGNPTVLSFTFFIIFLEFIFKITKYGKLGILFASSFLACVFLNHTIISVQVFYVFSLSMLSYYFIKKEFSKTPKYLSVVFLSVILSSFYIAQIDFSITTQSTIDWLRHWIKDVHKLPGSGFDYFLTVPQYFEKHFIGSKWYVFLIFGIFGGVIIYKKNKSFFIFNIIFICSVILLVINSQHWFLPLSHLIYPERTSIMLAVPVCIFTALGLEEFYVFSGRVYCEMVNKNVVYEKYIKYIFHCFLLLILILLIGVNNKKYFVNQVITYSTVTKEDMKAFHWMKENIDPEVVVQNNYGDAGNWIPSIVGNPITTAHVNVAYLDKIKKNSLKPKYVYIGKKCVYTPCLNASNYTNNLKFKNIYSKDGVSIFKILN